MIVLWLHVRANWWWRVLRHGVQAYVSTTMRSHPVCNHSLTGLNRLAIVGHSALLRLTLVLITTFKKSTVGWPLQRHNIRLFTDLFVVSSGFSNEDLAQAEKQNT